MACDRQTTSGNLVRQNVDSQEEPGGGRAQAELQCNTTHLPFCFAVTPT
jgi:hypothetical protein